METVKVNVKLDELLKQPLEMLRKHIKVLKWEGLFFIILGIVAILMPLMFSLAIEFILGVLFVLAGLGGFVRSFKAKDVPGTIASILFYLVFLVGGTLLISKPLLGIKSLAVILGFFFIISGLFKIAFAHDVKPVKYWGWSMFDGLLCLALGIIIFAEWPSSAPWIIGLLVGIRLIFLGNSLIMIGCGLDHAAVNSTVDTSAEKEPFSEEAEVKDDEDKYDDPQKEDA